MDSGRDRELARVQTFAKVLDDYLVDPLVGLVLPGIGDVLGSLLGLYIVIVAARRRVSLIVIARMLINLLVDMVIGVIPLVGDSADFAFKANKRNVQLLISRDATGGRARAGDWAIVVAIAVLWIAVISLVVYGFVWLVRAIA
jgi:hypothetical protein